jgi:hypothetical protein
MSDLSKELLDQAPKALLAALIPCAQFLWKWYNDQNREARKHKLLARIKQLTSQKESFEPLRDTPSGSQLLTAVDAEIEESIQELIELRTVRHPKPNSGKSRLARWFLLFPPSGVAAWIVHMLFFLNLATVALGLIGLMSNPHDPEVGSGILGLFIFLIPAFIFRYIAVRLAKSQTPHQSPA